MLESDAVVRFEAFGEPELSVVAEADGVIDSIWALELDEALKSGMVLALLW